MPILKNRQSSNIPSPSQDLEHLSANDYELQKKIHQLPTLFSNYQLADHQIQPENLQNIIKQKQLVETESSCERSPSSSPKFNSKRSFLKKIFSFDGKIKESSSRSVPPERKRLAYQAMSLNAAFNSISSSQGSSTEMVPHSVIKEKLLGVQVNSRILVDTKFKTDKSDKTLTTTTTTTNILETIPTSFLSNDDHQATFFNLGLVFNRKSNLKTEKQNYKDKMKSVNVRRKSSMLARGNPIMIESPHQNTFEKYNNRKEYLNTEKNFYNASKRGSIDCNNPIKCQKLGMVIGVSDAKFRERLIKLEKQYNDFNNASSQYLITPGRTTANRRKKAFNAIDKEENYKWENTNHLPYAVSAIVS